MKKTTIIAILFAVIPMTLGSTGCAPKSQNAASRSKVATEQSGSITSDSEFENRKPFKYTITTDTADFPKWAAESIDDNQKTITIRVHVSNTVSNGMDRPEVYSGKFDVDCDGDGKYEYIGMTDTDDNPAKVYCSFSINSGKHQISIRGDVVSLSLCSIAGCDDELYTPCFKINEHDQSQVAVVSVDDWGDLKWRSMQHFASDCYNLSKLPETAPNLENAIDMSYMFLNTKSLNQPLDQWDVSHIEDMTGMFRGAAFNQPLDHWDVSNVKYMDTMFWGSALSYYPSSWIIPESVNQEEMFIFSGVEKAAAQNPLKTRKTDTDKSSAETY